MLDLPVGGEFCERSAQKIDMLVDSRAVFIHFFVCFQNGCDPLRPVVIVAEQQIDRDVEIVGDCRDDPHIGIADLSFTE